MRTHQPHPMQAHALCGAEASLTRNRKLQFLASVLIAVVALTTAVKTHALDLGGLITGALRNGTVSTQDLVGVIRSVAQVSYGQIPSGAGAPQDVEGKVVLYRTAWCGYCKQAAAYMQQKAIPFVERDIETDPANKAEYTRLGGKGPVPFIVFGQKTMLGFSAAAIDQNYAEYQRILATRPSAGVGGPSAAPQPGDALIGKIPGVPIYRQPSKVADKLIPLAKADTVIYMGEERDGLYRVTTSQGEGWVDKLLVKKP